MPMTTASADGSVRSRSRASELRDLHRRGVLLEERCLSELRPLRAGCEHAYLIITKVGRAVPGLQLRAASSPPRRTTPFIISILNFKNRPCQVN